MQLTKDLLPKSKALLTNSIEQVIKTKKIPVRWLESKMRSHRPVRPTSVMYRMAMQAIKLGLSKRVKKIMCWEPTV